jgi:hypothetical protein
MRAFIAFFAYWNITHVKLVNYYYYYYEQTIANLQRKLSFNSALLWVAFRQRLMQFELVCNLYSCDHDIIPTIR